MNNVVIVASASLLVGASIGYFIGDSGDNSNSPTEQAIVTKVSSREVSVSNGRGDSPKTYEEIASLPGQTSRIQQLIDLYADLAPSEFKAEAEKLNELPFSERILASYLLFASWAEVAPYDALSHANSRMGFAGNFVKPTILQSWAASDASGAASYYESNKGEFAMMGMMGRGRGGRGPGGDSGASVIAGEWAKQDPEGALAWAETLEGREKGQAASGALAQIAKKDAADAALKLAALGDDASERAYRSVAVEWAKQDWDATKGWLNTLEGDTKNEAYEDALGSLASVDTDRAATEALALPAGELKSEVFEEVAEVMAGENAAEAMSWVMNNGDTDAQQESVGEVMNSWVGQDRTGALDWIGQQSEGELRDEAVASFIYNDHSQSDGSTIDLAESITDDRDRQRAIGVATFRWMQTDRDSAINYLQSSTAVDDEARNRMFQRMGIERD